MVARPNVADEFLRIEMQRLGKAVSRPGEMRDGGARARGGQAWQGSGSTASEAS